MSWFLKFLLFIISYNAFNIKSVNAKNLSMHDRAEEAHRIKIKNAQAKRLVNNAIKHFMNVDITQACYDFIYNPAWRKGELYVFLIDENGICLAQGDDSELIWKNLSKLKTFDKLPLIDQMLSSKKGRILGYMWNNSYMTSYVKSIKKNGSKFILGAGFFPQNSAYTVKIMVASAVAHFYAHGKEETFNLISQYDGPFRKGNIYTFAYDFDGFCVANGRNPAIVGQNLIDAKDSKGFHYIKNHIKIGKDKGKGWSSYYWLRSFKKTYVMKVVDPETKKAYVIGSGYHPNETFQVVQRFVDKAINYLKTNGTQKAFSEFNNKVGQFAYGYLYIFAFDLKGKCVADGLETGLVGQNLLKRIDQHGRYYVKDILRAIRGRNSGVASYYIRNAFTFAYVKKVHVPEGTFVICCEYIPDSKVQAVEGFVDRAVEYLKNNNRFNAFNKFTSKSGGFLQGDLSVFVYNTKGRRLASGFNKSQIWHDFSKAKDQSGKLVMEGLISKALNGGGWYEYNTLNTTRKVFARTLEKDKKTFIIGSGFFA